MEPTPATPATPPTGTPPEQPTTTPAAAPEQQQEQPQALTREVVEDIVQRAFDRAQRSSRDQVRNVKAEMDRRLGELQKLQIPVTPELTEKVREQAEAAVDQAANAPAQPAESQPADTPQPGERLYQDTMAYYKEVGVEVKPSDPEYAIVKAALDDPNGSEPKYYLALQKATDTKRTRTASQAANPDARVIGAGPSSSGVQAKSARDYYRAAHDKQ